MADKKITYKNSGVNIDEGNLFVKKIQPFVKSTATKNILNGTSSFAALYKLNINKNGILFLEKELISEILEYKFFIPLL